MSHIPILRPEAEDDLTEAIAWYNKQVPGLGSEFLHIVGAAIESIANNPRQYPAIYKDVHRALTRRFPYGIFCLIKNNRVVILAIFHAKRDPKHWQDRS